MRKKIPKNFLVSVCGGMNSALFLDDNLIILKGSGTSSEYTPEFLVAENVLVVTINYRLGLWGFLNAPAIGIPGNAGLKDQVFA